MKNIQVSIDYTETTVGEARLDPLFKFRKLTDTISFIDSITIDRIQTAGLGESIALSDLASMAVNDALSDSTGFADAIVVTWAISRTIADTITLGDLANNSLEGVGTVDETTFVVDALLFTLGVTQTDTVTLAEVFACLVAFPKTDGVFVGDSVAFISGIGIVESLSMSDNISLLSVSIEFSRLNHSVLGAFALNY